VTEKFTRGVVEVGHLVPARLPAADRRAVGQVALRLLDAVGLREGPAHTEVILTATGPRLVESHSRVGGDHINDLVRLATGVDLVDVAVARAVGLAPPPRPAGPGAGSIAFLVAEPGVVHAVTGTERAAGMPGAESSKVSVRVGDEVPALRSSDDRAGYVIASGADPGQALARARAMADAVVVTTRRPA
jgi:biotin carboxylase